MKKLVLGIFIATGLLLHLSCNSKNTSNHAHHHGHDHDHDHDHDQDHDQDHDDLEDGQVEMSVTQFKRMGMETAIIRPSQFRKIIKTSGQLIIPIGQETILSAKNDGIIRFHKTNLQPGASVSRNEAIAFVSAKDLASGDDYAKNQLRYEQAKKEFSRAELLMQDSLISERNYNQAKLEFETAELIFSAISPAAGTSDIPVASSINGHLRTLLVEDGAYVTTGQSIATVTSVRNLHLRADLPETYARELSNIQTASFRTSDGETHHDLNDLNGRLLSFARTLDKGSSYIPIVFQFDHVDHLVPGAFVEVYLKGTPYETITLPLEGIIEEQGLYFVFVKEEDEIYRKTPVQIGTDDGRDVEILAGVLPEDEVVIKGAYYLKLASMSDAIPHGHTH